MRKEIFSYLKIAAQIARQGANDRSFFLGCVGIRGSDQKIVVSFNGKSKIPERSAHAEFKCSRKLTPGSVIYVARIYKNGDLAIAKPCRSCIQALKNKGVTKVYFSINNFEFGQIGLEKIDLNKYKYREI